MKLVRRETVRMYSVPFRNEKVSQLISWYVETLQKCIDIIWEGIEWSTTSKTTGRGDA